MSAGTWAHTPIGKYYSNEYSLAFADKHPGEERNVQRIRRCLSAWSSARQATPDR